MIKKIMPIIFFICLAPSLSCRTLPQFTENTQLTFIDDLTIYSESKLLIIKRLSAFKLFEINGNIYNYDSLFTKQMREVYWLDNEKGQFPPGFLYDLDQDDAPLIKPIGYTKHFLP